MRSASIEPLGAITEKTHRAGALAISATAEGIALGLLRAPGDLASISRSARVKVSDCRFNSAGPASASWRREWLISARCRAGWSDRLAIATVAARFA